MSRVIDAEERTTCRTCGSDRLYRVLGFGPTPIADRLIRPGTAAEDDPLAPLTVLLCTDCWLMQIAETLPPELLFGDDYPYYSSVSQTLIDHSGRHVEHLIADADLGKDSFVVELASNDGYLLDHFRVAGVPHLGIDPAPGPANAAIERGIDTWVDFFNPDVADRVLEERGPADVVIANNVLAHVADVHGFLAGIARMLKPDGRAAFEFPYVVELMENLQFDTIYHQHLCYFSLHSVQALLARHGLVTTNVWTLPIHGGSLRVEARKAGEPSEAVSDMLAAERSSGICSTALYAQFADRVAALRTEVREAVSKAKADGLRLVAYGAAAKGTTLLSFCGFDCETLDYVVDRNEAKHGWLMPGSKLPILPVEKLLEEQPDLVLLLTWNFAAEIMSQQRAYLEKGGRFLVPIPHPRIADRAAA
ncbi:MAG: class I SAM-dependent methyltransferase [Pseudomonadota bacterium]